MVRGSSVLLTGTVFLILLVLADSEEWVKYYPSWNKKTSNGSFLLTFLPKVPYDMPNRLYMKYISLARHYQNPRVYVNISMNVLVLYDEGIREKAAPRQTAWTVFLEEDATNTLPDMIFTVEDIFCNGLLIEVMIRSASKELLAHEFYKYKFNKGILALLRFLIILVGLSTG